MMGFFSKIFASANTTGYTSVDDAEAARQAQIKKIEALLDSVNSASQHVRNYYITFLLACFYIALIVWSTTDLMLLKNTPVTMPLLNVNLPITGFYTFAPYFFLLLHFNLLLQFSLLADKVHRFDQAVIELPDSDSRRYYYTRLFAFVFTQTLSGRHHSGLLRSMLTLMIGITTIWLPLGILIGLQVGFLPYHDENILSWQRSAVMFDLLVLLIFWPVIRAPDSRWRSWIKQASGLSWLLKLKATMRPAPISIEEPNSQNSGYPVLEGSTSLLTGFCVIVFVWGIAVLPDSVHEKDVRDWLQANSVSDWWQSHCKSGETGQHYFIVTEWLFDGHYESTQEDEKQNKPCKQRYKTNTLHRNLVLREQLLIANELKAEDEADLRSSDEDIRQAALKKITPLVLSGRDLRYADFSEARMPKADLIGANKMVSDLRYANFERAMLIKVRMDKVLLKGAELTKAEFQGAELTGAQFQSAKLNEAEFQGAELIGAQFQSAKLNKAQFQGAILSGAQFQGAKLTKAEFQGAELTGAKFQSAKLNEAQFQGAILSGAQFQGAILGLTKFQGAELTGAQFKGAKSYYAEFQDAKLNYAEFQGAELTGAKFQGAELQYAEFQGAELNEAEFQGAELWYAKFQGSELTGAQFKGAKSNYAKFQDAKLNEAEFQGAELIGAKFRGAELNEAEFQGARLIGAEFQGAELSRARFHGAELDGAGFQGAELNGAEFHGAELSRARFHGAELDGAGFHGAELNGAQFQGAKLNRAEFQGADLEESNFTLTDISNAQFGFLTQEELSALTPKMDKIPDKALRHRVVDRLMAGTQSQPHIFAANGDNIWDHHLMRTGLFGFWNGLKAASDFAGYRNKLAGYLIELSCQDRWVAQGIIRHRIDTKYRINSSVLASNSAQCLLSMKDQKNQVGQFVCPAMSEIDQETIEILQETAAKKNLNETITPTFSCRTERTDPVPAAD